VHFTTSIELAGDCAITLLLLLLLVSPPPSLFYFPFVFFGVFFPGLEYQDCVFFLWVLFCMCSVSESLRFVSSLDKTLFLYVYVGEERERRRESVRESK
jgi:hypothetical protein